MKIKKKVAIALTAIVFGLIVSPAVALNEAQAAGKSITLVETIYT